MDFFRMLDAIKKLAPGVVLILLAAAVLLMLDKKHRGAQTPGEARLKRIAILQNASASILEDGVAGNIAGLAEAGFIHEKTAEIRVFKAEGDMAMLSQMAGAIVSDFDMVLTISTPGLQAVARQNLKTKVPHVFSLVTDPYGCGVGINAANHTDHPPYLAGIGTMQPVKELFEIVHQLNPGAKRIGIVWNPAEANSEAQVKIARKVCPEMGLELLEANAPSSTDVGMGAQSLVSRGIDMIWVNGDSTVISSVEAVVSAAKGGKIPVVSNIPGLEKKGVLLSIGANYFEVGHKAGAMAGEILNGKSPATIAIENYMPKILTLNTTGLGDLKDTSWKVPANVEKDATVVISAAGTVDRTVKRPPPPPSGKGEKPTTQPAPEPPTKSALDELRSTPYTPLSKTWNVYLIAYADSPPVEEALRGFKDAIAAAKLVEGKDYKLTVLNSQLDMATLGSMMDAARSANADMIVPYCTPALQSALRKFDRTPIVFSVVANPVLCGAGKSLTDHKPNVTGVSSASAMKEMAALVRQTFPQAKRVGTIFTPAESNSVYYVEEWGKALKEVNLELVTVPVEKPTDITEAAAALCRKDIDVLGQISDNLTASSFSAIAKAADKARIPVVGFVSEQVKQGAVLSLARDYYEMGAETTVVMLKIMRGTDPATIPMMPMRKTKLVVNPDKAVALGFKLPDSVVRRADEVIRDQSPGKR